MFRRILTTATAVLVVFAGAPLAHADNKPLATGTQIVVSNADGSATCTLGPRVTRDDRMVFLTSGHCAINNKRTEVYVNSEHVGTITHSGSPDSAATDVALVDVDQSLISYKMVGGIEQSKVLLPGDFKRGTPVCKVGATTGTTCGKYVGMNPDGTIRTTITADHGDSGAAVFVPFGDYRAGIIGLVSRGNDRFVMVTPIRNALLSTNTKLSTFNG